MTLPVGCTCRDCKPYILHVLQIEDRPVVKEVKTYVREHHPVEKEFVVETRPTGMSSTVYPCIICFFLLTFTLPKQLMCS